jgi:transposase
MHERFVERIETALTKLKQRLARRKSKASYFQVGSQIGRLLQKNSRGAGFFAIDLHEDTTRPCGLNLSWVRRKERDEWVALSEGCYLLRTNVTGMSAAELWRKYIGLTDVEDSFRTIKTNLDLRPIWHQKQGRVEAHILVAFLAFAAWKTIQKWSERAGLGSSVKTLIEALRSLQATDVILPTVNGREIRLPCVSTPSKPLCVLLQRLGLTVPKRLAAPTWIPTSESKM